MRKLERWVFAFLAAGATASCAKEACIDNNNHLGDGHCDKDYNNEECDYDEGDCCKCTCSANATYDCGLNIFACINPDAWCVDDDDVTAEKANCSPEFSGDAYCDLENNNEECGYDGGDCCECTCESTSLVACGSASDLGQSGFSCRDPNAQCDTGIVTFVASSSSSSSSSSTGEPVDVGNKTTVSVVANGHDTRGGGSSAEFGCGEAEKGGCEPYLTRDGDSTSEESRWSCNSKLLKEGEECWIKFFFDDPQDVVDIKVAFWQGNSQTHKLKVILNDQTAHTHESYTGSTFHSLGVQATNVDTVALEPMNLPKGDWIHLLEVLIMVKP